MTQVDPSSASHAVPSRHHLESDQQASKLSEISFASTLADAQHSHFNPALQSAGSTVNPPLPSTWSRSDYSVDPPPGSIEPAGRSSSSSASHKGKQPSNGHHIDPEHLKLGTIDETAAANVNAFTTDELYRSSANGYLRFDAGHHRQGRGRTDSADYSEPPYSPSTYPPTSEEDSEAKRVQQNLERWAAEERHRRKAQRSSKIGSNRNSAVSGASGITHRLSILRSAAFSGNMHNNLGAGPSSERLADAASASPSVSYTTAFTDRHREAIPRPTVTSSTGAPDAPRGLHRPASPSSFESSQSNGSPASEDHESNRILPRIGSRVPPATHGWHVGGGSAGDSDALDSVDSRHAHDPFRDPSQDDNFPAKRLSLKPTPTATRPIVTVGRASSIQRRALETSYKDAKGKGKGRSMPTIVATDTEAEAEEYGPGNASENPFSSSQDRSRDQDWLQRIRTTSTTIHQGGLDEEVAMEIAGSTNKMDTSGDLGESTLDTVVGARRAPARTSTSSSKFRELGISEGDDWIESVASGKAQQHGSTTSMRIPRRAQAGSDQDESRRPWWTELLCGCSRDQDDDEQVGSCASPISVH